MLYAKPLDAELTLPPPPLLSHSLHLYHLRSSKRTHYNSQSRAAAIRALLTRNATGINDETFAFLTETLKIPQTWLYAAQVRFLSSSISGSWWRSDEGC